MHLAEGIITGVPAAVYTGAGVGLVAWGVRRMQRLIREYPEKKALFGMGCAIVFFMSLVPIPAFTGTCTHPCGTPLVAILFGPAVGTALAGMSLLLQAAFFAHGGFSTWGANVVALGFFGSVFGWGTFRLARRAGLPLWAAGGLGGLVGDGMVYASSGFILGAALSMAPSPQYGLTGYLIAIYSAYLPTQIPIGVAEMVVTGLALHYAYKQRPEVLEDLGVVSPALRRTAAGGSSTLGLFFLAVCIATGWSLQPREASAAGLIPQEGPKSVFTVESNALPAPGVFSGMDEAVNERLAEEAGITVREPYLNFEELGDLWNALLLLAGGVCGFILGRFGYLLWGRPRGSITDESTRRAEIRTMSVPR